MSATEQMAQMLNELMGPKRNANFGDSTDEPDFDEPEVCKNFIVAFCPNEMFRNTKADLGACPKIHDPSLRLKYRASTRFEKLGYEEEFFAKIRRLDDEVRRKIEKNERRLAVTQPIITDPSTSSTEGESDAHRRQKELVAEQQASLLAKINDCMEKAESLGALGKVDEAKEAVRQADKFKQERAALDRLLNQSANPSTHIENLANQLSKPMEVCQVCGCFMLVNDVQQRIDDHYAGKQHMAYAKIRATIEEIDRKREDKKKEKMDRENRLDRERKHKDKRESRENQDRKNKDRDSRRDERNRDSDKYRNRSISKDHRNRITDRRAERHWESRDKNRDRRDDRDHYRR